MRIRKRQVLFPSSLSPVPLSDPHLINRSPVMVQLSDAAATTQHASAAAASSLDRYQPSDQPLPPIGKPTNGCDYPSGISESGVHRQHNKQEPLDEDGGGQDSEDSREKGNSHTRKGIILGSEIAPHVFPPSSPSSTQDGRWCEGEKAIPLKKRRGGFENGSEDDNKKTKARMKTKMNKKCSTQQNEEEEEVDDGEEEEEEEEVEAPRETKANNVNNFGKKRARARGSALMEGSRCSRVNGRGWRCCQQTLVGYSLCEHHLGKGRLRSMTSVRSRSAASSAAAAPKVREHDAPLCAASSSSSPEKPQTKCASAVADSSLVSDEKKPVVITKKRMKLGMVKARSISSLLGQTNATTTEIAVAHDEDNK